MYTFKGLEKVKVETLESGDIIAIAGIDNVQIGDTISSNNDPNPLPRIEIDEPTVSIFFHVNNGPFAGREGKYVTSRNISERLEKEILSNVSLQIIPSEKTDVFEVRGRGELQMAVLIETMRREGYEFMASRPEVIVKEINGKKANPWKKFSSTHLKIM
jgi:GTP-binding protein